MRIYDPFCFIFSILEQPDFQSPANAQFILSIVYNTDAGGSNATIPLNVYHPDEDYDKPKYQY